MSIQVSESLAKPSYADTPIKRCYTCAHWQGDKKKVLAQIAEYPMSMDLFNGWPESGTCGMAYHWADVIVRGDATATLEVNSNFGCPYWGALQ